jgi:hypothetical protein
MGTIRWVDTLLIELLKRLAVGTSEIRRQNKLKTRIILNYFEGNLQKNLPG